MARPLILLALAALLGGCALADEDNRRTLNALDARISPDSLAGRIAVAPLVLPLGVAAAATDQLLVHPIVVAPDAWDDTVDVLWTPDPQESAFKRGLLLPLALLATPPFLLGDWLIRSAFPVD